LHNFGHKYQYCISWTHVPIKKHTVVSNTTKFWKKKQEMNSQEECDLAMDAQDKERY